MSSTEPILLPESEVRESAADSLLLQMRSDRRLGHEWDDWDGNPLPNQGAFNGRISLFFGVAVLAGLTSVLVAAAVIWLSAPRLASLWSSLPDLLGGIVVAGLVVWIAWLGLIAVALWKGRTRIPEGLAEGGLLPWVMPRLERVAGWIGISRDVMGNSMLKVFDRLALGRRRAGIAPADLLILLPRCLGREAMRKAMEVSSRYDVPLFVASRGRYARQMLAQRRPKAVVAVACERDLVSGIHDVAGRLPVLATTLTLPDGPCKNTDLSVADLERQVRKLIGLTPEPA